MINKFDSKKNILRYPALILILVTGVLTIVGSNGTRTVTIAPSPLPPKQGDITNVRITASEKEELSQIEYSVNGLNGTRPATDVPFDVTLNTCKSNGNYRTTLTLEAEATYNDNEVRTNEQQYDLTVGDNLREDIDLDYAVYVSKGSNKDEEVMLDIANRFRSKFNSYSESQYHWSQKRYYKDEAIQYANSVDMAFSIGHGNHHYYLSSDGELDLSQTEFGNFTPCNANGDLEYLIFISCLTLSMEEVSATPFWYYWFHKESTKFTKKPFTGLHMVLGFRSTTRFNSYHWGRWRTWDGKNFVREFANKINSGWAIADAWIDAASDELKQSDGRNLAAVLYLREYENDTIFTEENDYIYGNDNYSSPGQKVMVYLD